VTAESGRFLRTDDPDVIIFRLTNGTLVHTATDFTTPRVLRFTAHDLPIDLPRFESFRNRGGRNLELTLPELARIGKDSKATEELRDTSRAAFHFRLVEVATMFLLPLLGLALGVPPKRSSSALGVFLSVVMIVAYHKVNEYGQSIGGLGIVDPIIALWVPFAIFAGLVIWMFYTVAFVPGGQPIGALERVFSKVLKAVTSRLPGARRTAATA
jgi:lipopolysaccharide export system permease protein